MGRMIRSTQRGLRRLALTPRKPVFLPDLISPPCWPCKVGPSTFSWRMDVRSEEHTSELQSRENLVCRLLLEKKKKEHDSSRPEKYKKKQIKRHVNTI